MIMTFDPNYYLTQYSNYFCEKIIGGIILYTFNCTKYNYSYQYDIWCISMNQYDMLIYTTTIICMHIYIGIFIKQQSI